MPTVSTTEGDAERQDECVIIRLGTMHPAPRILVALPLVSLGLLPSCTRDERPDVVIITVDTLRADHIGVYGASGSPTPHLDAFAEDATVFAHAAAPMPLTRPSHFSMLTSRYPREHGVLNNATALPETAATTAELLHDAGYRTAAFVGVTLLGTDSGAAQGFETFDVPQKGRERPAEEVVTRALEWLDRRTDEQISFLWLHLFDPHLPYAPPSEFRPAPLAAQAPISKQGLEAIAAANDGDVPRETLNIARALYRGEVAYTDHWLGRLLKGLERRIDLDRTMLVLTADHGECFENGIFFEHADCLYQPAMRIPLIVRYPPQFVGGREVETQTAIIDIAPTVLQAVGLEIPDSFSGQPLQDIDPNADRYVLVQHPFFQERAARNRPLQRRRIQSVAGEPTAEIVLDQEGVGLVGRDWKYLREANTEKLYRLNPSIDERNSLAADLPDIRDRMRARLGRALAEHPLKIIAPGEINDELRATLEALGYLEN